jgi:hypothetical protein
MVCPTSKNIAENRKWKNRTTDWRHPWGPLRHATRSSEALSHGDHWARFIDAASANGDDANVRMILPSFVHIDDRTRVQLSEPSRRL